MRNLQVSRAWRDRAYRDLCHRIATKQAEDEPSDPHVYNRLMTHFKSGVLEPNDFKGDKK